MYSPAYAIQNDLKENERIIRENPFATIVYVENGQPQSFHLPLLLEGQNLIGHLARANPAWKSLQGRSALFIFHGPHHYISPAYYGNEANVPTWNYISIQVRGDIVIREDETFLNKALLELSKKYDPSFNIDKNIADHKKLLNAIVGIEVHITEIFGKFKLAQSKSEAERMNVIKAIEEANPLLAQEMKRTIKSGQ